jgi:hypothetical protein
MTIMIRIILILTVLAALVPTAISNVSASADAEIALFSRASVDTDSLSISGNGDSAKMELKATNDDGKSNRVSGFQLTADNVLSIDVGDKVTVKDNADFTRAITTDAGDNQKAIGITSNGVVDFARYPQGVYTLDVVIDDDRAYEAIIVIGQQPPEVINKQITKINQELDTHVTIRFSEVEPDPDPKPCEPGEYCLPCPEGIEDDWCQDRDEYLDFDCSLEGMEDDPRCIGDEPDPCYIHPNDPNCGDWFDPGWCPVECTPEEPLLPISSPPTEPVDKGYIPGIGPIEPEPEPVNPEPVECGESEELVDGHCQPTDTNPVEPNDLVPIGDEDDNSDDQAIIDEDDTDESEDGQQDEDESGGSENEVEDEDSGEESEGESEEENGGN